jgi:hypothetical protein
MANNPFFADNTIVTSMNAMAALFNGGKLEIYSGSQPTDANTAVGAQTLLSTLTMNATAFPTAVASGSAGSKVCTLTANSITSDTSAAATGTAAWFRVLKSDASTKVMDGSVAASGTFDMILNTTSIVAGATVSCTSFTITQTE